MKDTIYRQEALEGLYDVFFDDELSAAYPKEADKVLDVIRKLPSAQPEIIRCKDCKWYGRADKRRFYRGMDCLQKRIDTIIPDKDFCSRAERREDGEKQ